MATAPARAQDSSEGVPEAARSTVRSTTVWLARTVDSWFGDRPFSDGGKVTDGKLSLVLLTRQHEAADFSVRFNARFHLPNFEESSYLFIGRDDPRDVVADKPGALSSQQRLLRDRGVEPSFFAGFGLRLRESVDFRLGFRGGLKPYVQARYQDVIELDDNDLIDFRQTIYWSQDDDVGSTTAASYEHTFSPTLASRWLTAATITQRLRRFEWSSSVGTYKAFGEQRLLSLEAVFAGLEGSGVAVTDYGLQTKWEQPIHKDWLLGEILVGHFWPRADATQERGRSWAVGASLKMKF